MNNVVVDGVVINEPQQEINENGILTVKFTLRNSYYNPKDSKTTQINIKCIAYGSVARYCNNEIYEGASVVVIGNITHRHYIVNGSHFDIQYVGCRVVSRLDQKDYEE